MIVGGKVNRINKWLSKRYGFHFVFPDKSDIITFLSGVVLGLVIYGVVLTKY